MITSGDWLVREVLRVDEKERVIYFLAAGREKGRDPYFSHLYRVNFDGTGLEVADARGRKSRHFHASNKIRRETILSMLTRNPTFPRHVGARRIDVNGRLIANLEKGGYLKAAGYGMKTSGADYCEGSRRGDGSLRADVSADESRPGAPLSDHQPHLSGAPGGERG